MQIKQDFSDKNGATYLRWASGHRTRTRPPQVVVHVQGVRGCPGDESCAQQECFVNIRWPLTRILAAAREWLCMQDAEMTCPVAFGSLSLFFACGGLWLLRHVEIQQPFFVVWKTGAQTLKGRSRCCLVYPRPHRSTGITERVINLANRKTSHGSLALCTKHRSPSP